MAAVQAGAKHTASIDSRPAHMRPRPQHRKQQQQQPSKLLQELCPPQHNPRETPPQQPQQQREHWRKPSSAIGRLLAWAPRLSPQHQQQQQHSIALGIKPGPSTGAQQQQGQHSIRQPQQHPSSTPAPALITMQQQQQQQRQLNPAGGNVHRSTTSTAAAKPQQRLSQPRLQRRREEEQQRRRQQRKEERRRQRQLYQERQQRRQKRWQHKQQPVQLELPGRPLGRASGKLLATALAQKQLPALPNRQQLKYFRQADKAFSAGELLRLHEHYLVPFVAERQVGASNCSGIIRERTIRDVLRQGRLALHYPASIATAVRQLRDAVPELAALSTSSSSQEPPPEVRKSPASRQLLLVLRCLRHWEACRVEQQGLPLLLQLQLFGRLQPEEEGVVEVVDLVTPEDEQQRRRQQRRQQQDPTFDSVKDMSDGVADDSATG